MRCCKGCRGCAASTGATVGALALGTLVVKLYSLPALLSFAGQDLMREPAFLCAVASSLLAVTAAVLSIKSGLLRPSVGELVAAGCAWLGFSFFLVFIWGASVLYYAVLLAPTHAFAILSLGACWVACRRERRTRRLHAEHER